MKIQKLILTSLVLIAICVTKLNAQTVYVTSGGKKYHAKNCSLVKTGKKGIELKEAIKQGYTPCKNCKADEIQASQEKALPPKNKSK